MEGFYAPSIIVNLNPTRAQSVHTDFDDLLGMSVIIALTEILLRVQNSDGTLEAITLKAGDVIYFKGELPHSGGDNPANSYRLHYYFHALGSRGFPGDVVYPFHHAEENETDDLAAELDEAAKPLT